MSKLISLYFSTWNDEKNHLKNNSVKKKGENMWIGKYGYKTSGGYTLIVPRFDFGIM